MAPHPLSQRISGCSRFEPTREIRPECGCDRRVARSLSNLGVSLVHAGLHEGAIEHMERALEIDADVFGAEHPSVAVRHFNLSRAFLETNDPRAALSHSVRALSIEEASLGPDHPETLVTLAQVALAAFRAQRPEEAFTALERLCVTATDTASTGTRRPSRRTRRVHSRSRDRATSPNRGYLYQTCTRPGAEVPGSGRRGPPAIGTSCVCPPIQAACSPSSMNREAQLDFEMDPLPLIGAQ